ncbi:macro domain-containing protein [Dyadobacter sp. SG02]|uniref:macro domain-containing protein n=1 Tax=Dyadobacter sp. SG02 TaxID=1855291 RepID=UPI001E41DE53|nr:macro domain-containing protein [Dyadobacter sp. SG02]
MKAPVKVLLFHLKTSSLISKASCKLRRMRRSLQLAVNAIINAANTSLFGGGGVDGAIHRAVGNAILEECRKVREKQGGCKVGQGAITTAGKPPAKLAIYTARPVLNGGSSNEDY